MSILFSSFQLFCQYILYGLAVLLTESLTLFFQSGYLVLVSKKHSESEVYSRVCVCVCVSGANKRKLL